MLVHDVVYNIEYLVPGAVSLFYPVVVEFNYKEPTEGTPGYDTIVKVQVSDEVRGAEFWFNSPEPPTLTDVDDYIKMTLKFLKIC